MDIGGFIPVSTVDYPDRISFVVFTQGCNFRCPYCHNAGLVKRSFPSIDPKDILEKIKTHSKLIDSVVISGGEPLIQKDIIPFIEAIKELKLGLKIKLDTNGYNANVLEDIIDLDLVNYIAMDLKVPYEKYEKIVKVKIDITKIYRSIGLLLGSSFPLEYEFRTTVLPEFTEEDIHKLGSMVKNAEKYALQNFNNKNTLDEKWTAKTPHFKEILEQYKKILEKYVKNVELRTF